jgi:hypothetical protein
MLAVIYRILQQRQDNLHRPSQEALANFSAQHASRLLVTVTLKETLRC